MEMRKTELFAEILENVANEMELTKEQILSRDRTAEIVDARHIVIFLLAREGYYNSQIAKLMKTSRQYIGQVIRGFSNRCKQSGKIFEITLNRICRTLESK